MRHRQALRKFALNDLFSTRKGRAIHAKDIDTRRQHMNALNRCHFQLKGGAKFDALISQLVEYVDSLLKICSEVQAEVCMSTADGTRPTYNACTEN